MSPRERVIALLDDVPDYKMGYVLAYIQGLTADEATDEEFCMDMYLDYLDDPEKGDLVPFEDALKECGVSFDEL